MRKLLALTLAFGALASSASADVITGSQVSAQVAPTRAQAVRAIQKYWHDEAIITNCQIVGNEQQCNVDIQFEWQIDGGKWRNADQIELDAVTPTLSVRFIHGGMVLENKTRK